MCQLQKITQVVDGGNTKGPLPSSTTHLRHPFGFEGVGSLGYLTRAPAMPSRNQEPSESYVYFHFAEFGSVSHGSK